MDSEFEETGFIIFLLLFEEGSIKTYQYLILIQN